MKHKSLDKKAEELKKQKQKLQEAQKPDDAAAKNYSQLIKDLRDTRYGKPPSQREKIIGETQALEAERDNLYGKRIDERNTQIQRIDLQINLLALADSILEVIEKSALSDFTPEKLEKLQRVYEFLTAKP